MIPSISRHHPQMSASDDTEPDVSDTTPQKTQQGRTHTRRTDSHHSSGVPVSRGIYSLHTLPGGFRELGADHRGTENNIRPLSHFSGRGAPPPAGLRSLAIWRINRV